MSDERYPEILERIRKLFEGKTPEKQQELMRMIELIVHHSMLHGDIKKKISGRSTDTRFQHCQKARMILPRKRKPDSLACPETGFLIDCATNTRFLICTDFALK